MSGIFEKPQHDLPAGANKHAAALLDLVAQHFATDHATPGLAQVRALQKATVRHAPVVDLHDLGIGAQDHIGGALKVDLERAEDLRIGIRVQQKHRLPMS